MEYKTRKKIKMERYSLPNEYFVIKMVLVAYVSILVIAIIMNHVSINFRIILDTIKLLCPYFLVVLFLNFLGDSNFLINEDYISCKKLFWFRENLANTEDVKEIRYLVYSSRLVHNKIEIISKGYENGIKTNKSITKKRLLDFSNYLAKNGIKFGYYHDGEEQEIK